MVIVKFFITEHRENLKMSRSWSVPHLLIIIYTGLVKYWILGRLVLSNETKHVVNTGLVSFYRLGMVISVWNNLNG